MLLRKGKAFHPSFLPLGLKFYTMRLSVILLLLCCCGSMKVLKAQAYPGPGNPNEVKLNLGLFLATGSFEGSYEYYLSDDISLGGTLYFDNDPRDFNGDFGIGPNFRAYFGFQPRSGFFAEAFALYHSGEDEGNTGPEPVRQYDSFALGLGMGHKWTTRTDRLSLEFFGGFGRNINPEPFQGDFVYRAGLNLGIRF